MWLSECRTDYVYLVRQLYEREPGLRSLWNINYAGVDYCIVLLADRPVQVQFTPDPGLVSKCLNLTSFPRLSIGFPYSVRFPCTAM
jgi:hypothetical protein